MLFKNCSNVDGKIFAILDLYQPEQDTVIKEKNMCENVSLK